MIEEKRVDNGAGAQTSHADQAAEAPHASGNGTADDSAAEGRGPAAFQRLFDEFQDLRDQFALLWAAKVDSARLSLRRFMLAVALGLLGLLLAATYLATATVLVIVGIGEGLGSLFGDRLWLGHLTTGAALLAILALGIYLGLRRMARASHERTVLKYARRRERQNSDRDRASGHKPASN